MPEIGEIIRKLRGKQSLREAGEKIGISHTYLDTIEKGFDKRSGNKVSPSPDTLRLISKAYHYPYEKLLQYAGYIDEDKEHEIIDPELEIFINDVRMWYEDDPEDRGERLQMLKEMFEVFKKRM